jgi:hypothetical protein
MLLSLLVKEFKKLMLTVSLLKNAPSLIPSSIFVFFFVIQLLSFPCEKERINYNEKNTRNQKKVEFHQ